jgi:hypothetical protein
MALILRSEKGSPLTSAELDGNFSYLKGILDTLESGITAESIQSIDLTDGVMNIIGSEGTTWGPFTMTVPLDGAGEWETAMAYAVGDVVTKDGKLHITLINHMSGTYATDIAAGKLKVISPAPVAANTGYDNAASGLTATQVQAAIDELVGRVVALETV